MYSKYLFNVYHSYLIHVRQPAKDRKAKSRIHHVLLHLTFYFLGGSKQQSKHSW